MADKNPGIHGEGLGTGLPNDGDFSEVELRALEFFNLERVAMTEINNLLQKWTEATGDLKPGVQRVFHDVFDLASQEKTHLIYGADYHNGMPCLVNTVGAMLTTGGGYGIPISQFGEVVRLFDLINNEFFHSGVNTTQREVSPLAAEILLKHFAPLKEMEVSEIDPVEDVPYREPSDEAMAKAMVDLFTMEAPNNDNSQWTETASVIADDVSVVRRNV